jgi:two-component system LytT family sensor kinase
MPGINEPLLINILGHAAGVLIFAIFLGLLFSGRGWSGARGRYLSGLAAILSCAWNLGSLIVLTRPGLPPRVMDVVVALSFSVLSLLPAVLLDISLENRHRALAMCGYALSAVAVAMHFGEMFGQRTALHQRALLLITIGFLVLAAARVALGGGARIAASMCLALFAMSFVHFGTGHAVQAWSSELVIHHAGIPLALFVLLQDYRFVLLDAFVRFLANALLAAVLTWLVIRAAFRLLLVERAAPDPLQEALLLISVCLFLVFFAWLRNLVLNWLNQAVFRQGSVAAVAERLREAPENAGEDAYLEWAASQIANAVRAKDYAVVTQGEAGGERSWTEAKVPIRLTEGDSRAILLGARQGGQRYLSEDLVFLGKAAAEIEAHVESLRREEMNRLVSQAELRALQSQINPHFLFNALNALYGTIPREAAGARRIVLNLADIFRYFLQTDKVFVPLAEEMQIVRAYLEVEQCRLGDRLTMEIQVDDAALEIPIPVLSIQPLVENAVKHGVSPRMGPGYVRIQARCDGEALRITVENSGSGSAEPAPGMGVGLNNVRRRIEICYGSGADLTLAVRPDQSTVELRLPVPVKAVASSPPAARDR